MNFEIQDFFRRFIPCGALLDPETESRLASLLGVTADRVLLLRTACNCTSTNVDHVLQFVEHLNLLGTSHVFAASIADANRQAFATVRRDAELKRKMCSQLIEGDWHLRSDLEHLLEPVAKQFVQDSSVLGDAPFDPTAATAFRDNLRIRLDDPDDASLLYNEVGELGDDKYLVYFMNMTDVLKRALRGALYSRTPRPEREEVERLTEAAVTVIENSTALLSATWADSTGDPAITDFVPPRAERYVNDLLIASHLNWISLSAVDALELVDRYCDSQRCSRAIEGLADTPDEPRMARVRHRWQLRSEYSALVFGGSFERAPVTSSTRTKLDAVVAKFADAGGIDGFSGLPNVAPVDLATSLAIQRHTSVALGEVSGFYADITWPAWRYNMAYFPEIAINALLQVIVPSIISGAVGAYAAWLLAKRKAPEDKRCSVLKEDQLRDVVDESCAELLRYRYYLFDANDTVRAAESADQLAASFQRVADGIDATAQPALHADVSSLNELFRRESSLLRDAEAKEGQVYGLLAQRHDFVASTELSRILESKARQIVVEHIAQKLRTYERDDSTDKELEDLTTLPNEAEAIATTTAQRILGMNAPYILALAIRHFLFRSDVESGHLNSKDPETASGAPMVFMAHASEDKPAIRELYAQLVSHGFRVWLDEIALRPGQNWRVEIPKAIRESDVFLACLSARSVRKRGYIQHEFRLALSAYSERPADSVYLIPVKLDECDVPDLQIPELGAKLRDIQWVNVWQNDGLQRLVEAIQGATK